jgi:lipoyl(octanoyl) transferase
MFQQESDTRPKARIFEAGRVEYDKARKLQLQLVEQRIKGKTDDTFIFCEHPPTITIGRSGGAGNIVVSDEKLNAAGVKKYEVERGGDVTFHGPGQQVIYPIVSLEERGRDLHRFMRDLEKVVISFLRNYDVEGCSVPGKTGVWVGEKKICAIGVAVRRWTTFHGLALNLDTDLGYFQLINPCGFDSGSVTSLQALTGTAIDKPKTFFELTSAIEEVFSMRLSL